MLGSIRLPGWLLPALCLLGLLLAIPSFAAPPQVQNVPPPLRDWQAWVLHDNPQHDCPFLANQMPDASSYACAWPGRLTLDVGNDGARFALSVQVDAPSWVALPGDAKSWPQQVVIDRQPATVLQHEGWPMVWLEPGSYQLHGVLPWSARPSGLRVPAAIGLVALSIDGVAVAHVERNGEQLTLGEAAATQRAADALSLRVYRQLQDGLPAMLETRWQIQVTGSAREQVLGPVLPAGFVATALSGDLPARLDGDARLHVQLRSGDWTLTLAARSLAPLHTVALKLPAAPWPRQEIWSYADDTGLRSTHVQGSATDAAQAGVPSDWSALPAFVLDDASGLTIEQGTRGQEGRQGDQVHLRRQLWLDFDGGGLSVADHLAGQLRQHERLDVTAPWQLQRAAQAGEPLLVTQDDAGHRGVELRTSQLDLDAGLRLPAHGGAMPSTGWQLPLDGIDATLHLPYGYRLLGALGVDRSPDSWVAQWSLLDLFVLAAVALLAGRLLGWPWALVTAGFLVLAQHESGAPRWTLALVLVLALLLRALPDGRLRWSVRLAALCAFVLGVLWTLPFAAGQLQYALHPQLESRGERVEQVNFIQLPAGGEVMTRAKVGNPTDAAPAEAAPAPAAPPAPSIDLSASADGNLAISQAPLPQANYAVDTHSVIQAGAGTPHWDVGNDYRLGWSGPVTASQTTRLLIAPSWLVRLLRVAMIALLGALLARLVPLLRLPWQGRWPKNWRSGTTAAAALLLCALLPHPGHAQTLPGQPLLQQLHARLTEAPPCAPACAAVAQATLQANGDTLLVTLEAHAGAVVALPLPQPDGALQVLDASLDGHDAALARRGEQLVLRLERGVHRIGLRYRIGAGDSAGLRFPVQPQRIDFDGRGWSLDGLDGARLLGDSVTLHRVLAAGNDGKAPATAQDFPPYVRLTRSLVMGVDWTVENVVERIAPEQGGFGTSLPLLPGEHPLGDDAPVSDGRIRVTFVAGQDSVRWTSRLDHAAQLALHAPALGERAEVWDVHAAPQWHVDASGVPPSASDDGQHYQPLPGESLQLKITRPDAVAGESLAFDNVGVTSEAGERVTQTTLDLRARSTRGGEHAIDLPQGAELLATRRDGASINLAVRNGQLSLPLLPGAHDYTVSLREPQAMGMTLRTPLFALHAPAANVDLTLQLPQDRWVLWTWGPTVGPAVLYWSQLLVLLLAAWLLARYAPTPLRFHHWLLLGLGFSAFAWSAYALVVAWLVLLGVRARGAPSERLGRTGFNLMQLGLALLTLLALTVLIAAVPKGLLGHPDMHVAGNASSASNLHWLADRALDGLPRGGVFSVPLWLYKLAMLAWALWLANALIGWLRWGFDAWMAGGYWRPREPARGTAPPDLPQPAMEPPTDA